jgi:hypothetical protein
MRSLMIWVCLSTLGLTLLANSAVADPNQTIVESTQVLSEIMAIPARQIPESFLKHYCRSAPRTRRRFGSR